MPVHSGADARDQPVRALDRGVRRPEDRAVGSGLGHELANHGGLDAPEASGDLGGRVGRREPFGDRAIHDLSRTDAEPRRGVLRRGQPEQLRADRDDGQGRVHHFFRSRGSRVPRSRRPGAPPRSRAPLTPRAPRRAGAMRAGCRAWRLGRDSDTDASRDAATVCGSCRVSAFRRVALLAAEIAGAARSPGDDNRLVARIAMQRSRRSS